MKDNLYLDIHIIQTLPPSCVNRDDLGIPKSAIVGNTKRARISSQCIKHAVRSEFQKIHEENNIGYRTRNSEQLIGSYIAQDNPSIPEEESQRIAGEILKLTGVKSDKGKAALFFISSEQAKSIAALANEFIDLEKREKSGEKIASEKKAFKKRAEDALSSSPSHDILLFGRMAAGNPNLNVDASVQVAHAISTHECLSECDYFAAVDDFMKEGDAGAAHINVAEYNSFTMYKYGNVNCRELADHMTADELGQTVKDFVETFSLSMPTGKQNSFANRTVPDLIYITVRTDMPVNFAPAFENPIKSEDKEGYIEKSKDALFNEARITYQNYVPSPEKSWIIAKKEIPDDFVEKTPFSTMLDEVYGYIFDYAEKRKG